MMPQETGSQEAVERALAAARSDDCVAIADETSSANLRWAGNTLTPADRRSDQPRRPGRTRRRRVAGRGPRRSDR